MPGNDGFTGLTQLQNNHSDLIVIMVSSDENPDIMQKAINFGAAAFIPKSVDLATIAQAIKVVLGGDTFGYLKICRLIETLSWLKSIKNWLNN